MSHLSSPTRVMAMVFYSILTFFVGPFLTRPLISKFPDPCLPGFVLGFCMSILLWCKFGYFL